MNCKAHTFVSMNRELNRSTVKKKKSMSDHLAYCFHSVGQIGNVVSESYINFCLFFLQLSKELIISNTFVFTQY